MPSIVVMYMEAIPVIAVETVKSRINLFGLMIFPFLTLNILNEASISKPKNKEKSKLNGKKPTRKTLSKRPVTKDADVAPNFGTITAAKEKHRA